MFFTHDQDHGQGKSVSTHVALLRDARKFTNRDLVTGKVLSDDHALVGSWLGNLGYLMLLDQMGSAISLKGKRDRSNKSGILKCLSQFSSLSNQQKNALYALRNSFAHNYSIINIGKKPSYHFRFALRANKVDPMLTLPKVMWNGDINSGGIDSTTVLNLWAFGDFVEQIIDEIKVEYLNGNIEINLEGGNQELLAKFIFFITNQDF